VDWYSVRLETRAPAGAEVAIDEDAADKLMNQLEGYSGIVSTGCVTWSATISVRAPDAARAVSQGARIIEKMAGNVGLPAWPQVRAEAVRQDVLHQEVEQPTLPELVSAPEAAEILGVSSQRLHELARAGREFPAPVYELKTGRLWLRYAIVAFAACWDRKPGRPEKAALLRERVASALTDCGITATDALVRLTADRTVVLEIPERGGVPARISVGKIIDSLSCAGLGIKPGGSSSAEDLEKYLANGHPAVVFENAG